MDIQVWKQEIPKFRETTSKFMDGEISQAEYKRFSGFYGSYAQRGGKNLTLRLRMPCGCVTKEKLEFIARVVQDFHVQRIHFTTCQTIQLHDLSADAAADIMEAALEAGIITIGGGGDYPRNVMCSPLSGVENDEYFDVMPWAMAAHQYLMTLIPKKKMPRKLKVAFSNTPQNVTHATYRDLGFVATKEGKFDVYSAGGLGLNPCLGVKVAQAVEPGMILYYIKAMWMTFLSYGNYENHLKARTRYMQESLGGVEQYLSAYVDKLKEALDSDENLYITAKTEPICKEGDGSQISGKQILQQKQEGLYTVVWHPIGGRPDIQTFCDLNRCLQKLEQTQLRLSPDETAYIINLTATEAKQVLDLVSANNASSLFEISVSCIGASVCQVGVCDSQELLKRCIHAVRQASIPDGALPQIHISGCPSSCGTHQTGVIGFRGGIKKINGKMQHIFVLYLSGCEQQGHETLGREVGSMPQEKIPEFLVQLGKEVAKSGMDFIDWKKQNPDRIDKIAAEYLV